jgi:hypothetical protein
MGLPLQLPNYFVKFQQPLYISWMMKTVYHLSP